MYTGIHSLLMVTTGCPGPVAANQNLGNCYEVVELTCCVRFSLWPNHFVLVSPKDIVPAVLWFVQMQLCNLSCTAMSFLERRGYNPATLSISHACTIFFILVLSWTLTSNMPTEACRVWDVAPGMTGNCLECFSSVNNLSHFQILWKWPYNLSQIDGQQHLLL